MEKLDEDLLAFASLAKEASNITSEPLLPPAPKEEAKVIPKEEIKKVEGPNKLVPEVKIDTQTKKTEPDVKKTEQAKSSEPSVSTIKENKPLNPFMPNEPSELDDEMSRKMIEEMMEVVDGKKQPSQELQNYMMKMQEQFDASGGMPGMPGMGIPGMDEEAMRKFNEEMMSDPDIIEFNMKCQQLMMEEFKERNIDMNQANMHPEVIMDIMKGMVPKIISKYKDDKKFMAQFRKLGGKMIDKGMLLIQMETLSMSYQKYFDESHDTTPAYISQHKAILELIAELKLEGDLDIIKFSELNDKLSSYGDPPKGLAFDESKIPK